MEGRGLRRRMGLLAARLPELDLDAVADPRAREGKWSLGQILRATLVGLMAGCKGLWDAEQLTANLSVAARRQLGLPRRLADTTARDALCKLSLDELRSALHRLVKAAWRRKALQSTLPVRVVALDGKVTALPCINQRFIQVNHTESGMPYGLVRTVTAALVSAPGRPCIDAIPIPASTNEMGHFQTAFGSVLETYGGLFDVVTYDAGALSEANGAAVVEANKHYVFRLRGDQRTMYKLATEMLDPADAVERTIDVLDSRTTVTRTLTLVAVDPSWGYGNGKGPDETVWTHARTFLRIDSEKIRDGIVVESEMRMSVSSMVPGRLTPKQWMHLVRAHWGVENNNHHTLDTAFAEDDRPWIEADANGMLAVLILRRIAYTILALYRSVTLRSDEHRSTRWRDLMRSMYDALIAATVEQTMNLRRRELCAAAR
jgi:hypothetical protein